MKEALDKNIYTRGAGGNFPRNVALSPLSGVDKEEAFDPTPYAVATGEYFMESFHLLLSYIYSYLALPSLNHILHLLINHDIELIDE